MLAIRRLQEEQLSSFILKLDDHDFDGFIRFINAGMFCLRRVWGYPRDRSSREVKVGNFSCGLQFFEPSSFYSDNKTCIAMVMHFERGFWIDGCFPDQDVVIFKLGDTLCDISRRC